MPVAQNTQTAGSRTRSALHTVRKPTSTVSAAPTGLFSVVAVDTASALTVGAPSRTRVIMDGAVNRSLDFLTAALALLILRPAIAIIALLIKLDSPGPVFYRASRVGR